MSKLASEDKFIDLSDYGRSSAQLFVNLLKDTSLHAVHITLLFGISGLIAVYCILNDHYYFAGFFLILKSMLDAADGEMSRVKNQPSYTGRYLDSIFDIILNFLILWAIASVVDANLFLTVLAFICFQLHCRIRYDSPVSVHRQQPAQGHIISHFQRRENIRIDVKWQRSGHTLQP